MQFLNILYVAGKLFFLVELFKSYYDGIWLFLTQFEGFFPVVDAAKKEVVFGSAGARPLSLFEAAEVSFQCSRGIPLW